MNKAVRVTKKDLWTIVWGGNNNRPDLCRDIALKNLGLQPYGDIADEAVDSPGAEPDSGKPKVALMVGHNERQKGAEAGGKIGMAEYDFNNKVAVNLVAIGRQEITYKQFNRAYEASYSREIDKVYGQIEGWNPDLILELHFNSGANYSTMLAPYNSPVSNHAAGVLQRHFVKALGTRSYGIINRRRGERGGRGLYAASAPTVLTEGFSGDVNGHLERVEKLGVSGISKLYHGAVKEIIPTII